MTDEKRDEKQETNRRCPKCGGEMTCQVVTSLDDAYEDDKYTCKKCDYVFWVDGIDA